MSNAPASGFKRKNIRIIIFFSCLLIILILLATLLFTSSYENEFMVDHSDGGEKRHLQYLLTLSFQDELLEQEKGRNYQLGQKLGQLERELKASQLNEDDLVKQLEDSQDFLAARREEKEAYEDKIQELLDQLAENSVKINSMKEKMDKGHIQEPPPMQKLSLETLEDELFILTQLHQTTLEANGLRNALLDNADVIEDLQKRLAKKDEILRASLAIEEHNKKQLKNELEKLKEEQKDLQILVDKLKSEEKNSKEMIQDLFNYEKLYNEELQKRLVKEELVEQLKIDLEEQKVAIGKMEETRNQLVADLRTTQESYRELFEEINRHSPEPLVSVDFHKEEIYTVQPGDTLMSIAKKHYGTSKKWKHILETNKNTIPDQNRIKPGTRIVLPE